MKLGLLTLALLLSTMAAPSRQAGGRGRGAPQPQAATPKQPRRVLVVCKAAGYVHSSIPLTARTIEALGQKTGAWDTVITYDPAVITAGMLRPYDAGVLAGTPGKFLDAPVDAARTTARRQALLDFVRSGKALVGVHAAADTYHGSPDGKGP